MHSEDVTVSKSERNYRADCAKRGYEPDENDWVIQDIRSGEWERRQRANVAALEISKALAADTPPVPPAAGIMIELKGDGIPPEIVAAFQRQAILDARAYHGLPPIDIPLAVP